jgi:hypothetical protein
VAFRSDAGNLGAGPAASIDDWQAYVRDVRTGTTELASRADGPAGGPIDTPRLGSVSISGNGGCVAFDATGLNIGDGYASPWFPAVHLRVLRGECPSRPPAGAPGQSVTPSRPAALPVLSALMLVPNRFSVVPLKAVSGRRHPGGTSIRFRLSLAARVTFAFAIRRAGRRTGRHCLPAHGVVPRRRRCTRFVPAGSLARLARAGADRIPFSGRIGRRALARGAYRMTATPVVPPHRRVHSHSAAFTIARS